MLVTDTCPNAQSLAVKLEKIFVIKWLLELENREIELTENMLQEMLDIKLNRNFAGLVPLVSYLQTIPQFILKNFYDIIDKKFKTGSYNEFYNNFKDNLRYNDEYKNFNQFIEKQIFSCAIMDNIDFYSQNLEAAEKAIFEEERIINILIYNIISEVCNDTIKFECDRNIVLKFHILIYWSTINKFKPIEKLNEDECQIISSLLAGFSNERILELLNLPPTELNYNYLNKIFNSLPEKFHVTNLTQVIFRMLLLKPQIWQKSTVESILYEIKNLHRSIYD